MLLTQCAKQIPPTGGAKDEAPPLPIRVEPASFSTNINPTTVTIEFNEFIELKDATTQVFISPTTREKPQVKLRNKTIVLTVPDSLKPNTTYSVYFGNAIRDITEGNVLNNFQYVFSTGDFIDSLRLQGFVMNSLDNKFYKNALVMLRSDTADSAIVKSLPDYIARTDENGFYHIDYLHTGKYRVTALDDVNSNFKYEPSEAIGFHDTLVNVTDTSKIISMHLFRAEPAKNRLLSARMATGGRTTLAFAKSIENLNAQLEPSNGTLQYTHTLQRDTVMFFLPKVETDTVRIRVKESGFDTLLVMRVPPGGVRDTTQRKGRNVGSTAGLEITTNLARRKEDFILPYGYPLQLTFSVPVAGFDSARMRIVTVNDSTKALPITSTLEIDTLTHRNVLRIDFAPKIDSVYRLMIDDSLAHDPTNNRSRKLRAEFRGGEPEDNGNLIIHVKGLDSTMQYIAVLRAVQFGYERKWVVNGKQADIKVNNLVPGAYALVLIADANKNGRRDSGNYWEHRQPERTFTHSGGITVRANWDVEVTLNTAPTANQKTADVGGQKQNVNNKK